MWNSHWTDSPKESEAALVVVEEVVVTEKWMRAISWKLKSIAEIQPFMIAFSGALYPVIQRP